MKHLSRLSAAVLAALACNAFAAENTPSTDKKEEKAERIEVTGSRIKRADMEDAAPVIVISNEEMQTRGHVTVADAIKGLTQNTGSVQGAEYNNGFTPDVQTVNLRSIGVGYTLMLVNGRRMAAYPAAYNSETSVANFGAIPTAAVERVEILTTGASAIYGSDAVAGVINIILKKNIDETSVNLLWGNAQEAGRDNLRLQALTGTTWDSGSLSIALELQDQEGIKAGDYSRFDSWYDYPYGQGFVDRAIVEIGVFNPRGYRDPGNKCAASGNDSVRSFRPGSGWFCGLDFAAEQPLRNSRKQISGFANLNQDLGGDLEAYATLMWYDSESSSVNNSLTVGEYFYTGADFWLAQRRFTGKELGVDLSPKYEDSAVSLSAGLKGVAFGDHDWELNIARSDYEFTSRTPWLKAKAVVDTFLGDLLGFSGASAVWAGNGSYSLPANLYKPLPANIAKSLLGTQEYGNDTFSQSAQFTLSGTAFEMSAGPAQYAFVAEYENSGFEFIPDALIAGQPPISSLKMTGWWNLTGYQGKGERDRSALGGELSMPLTESLTLNVAARQDFYDKTTSKSGGRLTPGVSLEWRPVEGFFVRGGYSESFRAPDLNYVFSNTGAYTSATDYTACFADHIGAGGTAKNFDTSKCGDYQTSIYYRRTGTAGGLAGTEQLEDESGYSANLGFVWDITEDLNVSVDFFRQYLKDRVVTESADQLLLWEYMCSAVANKLATYADYPELNGGARCTYVKDRVPRSYDPYRDANVVGTLKLSPLNSAELQADSLDVKINYKTDIGPVRSKFAVDYTNSLQNRDRERAGEPWFDNLTGNYAFRSMGSFAAQFAWEDFEWALTAIRRGSTINYRPSRAAAVGEDGRVGSYTYYNLALGYNFTPKNALRLRVNNLFNDKPPMDRTMTSADHPWYNVFVYGGAGLGRQLTLDYSHTF